MYFAKDTNLHTAFSLLEEVVVWPALWRF